MTVDPHLLSHEERNVQLARRVSSYLRARQIASLQSIEIDVCLGTLVVRGRVPSASVKHKICECCRHVAGVFHVIDELEINSA